MDLTQLTPDQLVKLKAQLDSLTDVSGRSPIRPRQLHDLRLLPTATDPRPLFIPSAEQPRDYVPGAPKYYPKLMWHRDTNEEITVHSRDEEQDRLDLYTPDVPMAIATQTPMEDLRDALDLLTPEERELVLDSQKKERISKLKDRLAGLSEVDLERLLGKADAPKRGRPRKTQVA